MVNTFLLIVCAASIVVWVLQEVAGRRQMLVRVSEPTGKNKPGAVALAGYARPAWMEITDNILIFGWVAWLGAALYFKDGDFALILSALTLFCLIVSLIDILIFQRRRENQVRSAPLADVLKGYADKFQPLLKEKLAGQLMVAENARSFLPVLAIVLVVRSFALEPFQIPSPSMEPSLLTGDYILVNKYAYGLRLPVFGTKIMPVGDPEAGDVMVFFPPNDKRYFIKRVVGVPGDEISYVNKVLYINGEKAIQQPVEQNAKVQWLDETFPDDAGAGRSAHTHRIQHDKQTYRGDFSIKVKPGHYFMMGDNRDNSSDSRYWGQVPEENVVGKAVAIWMHWPSIGQAPSFDRVGTIR